MPGRREHQACDDTGQLLWGDRMPSRTLSGKLRRVYAEIDEWRTEPLEGEYPYVFVGGVWHKRSWGGSVENVGILVAIGVSKDGHREAVGVAEGMGGGGFRQLGAVLSRHDRTRPEGRPARGRRPVHGTGRHGGLDAAEGENIIVYSPGSNAQMCHETGVKVLLNDSPFMSTIPAELIEASDVLLVNEHEMAQLLGIDEPDDDNWGAFDWQHAADRMAEYGFKEAIVTLVATVLWCWTPQLLKASGLCASLR